jgi:hypothetical protein
MLGERWREVGTAGLGMEVLFRCGCGTLGKCTGAG